MLDGIKSPCSKNTLLLIPLRALVAPSRVISPPINASCKDHVCHSRHALAGYGYAGPLSVDCLSEMLRWEASCFGFRLFPVSRKVLKSPLVRDGCHTLSVGKACQQHCGITPTCRSGHPPGTKPIGHLRDMAWRIIRPRRCLLPRIKPCIDYSLHECVKLWDLY